MKTDYRTAHSNRFSCLFAFSLLTSLSFDASSLFAEDWPQWNGGHRDGKYTESNTIEEIPKTGIKKKWSTKVGLGYSGPVVSHGKVFVSDYQITSGEVKNDPSARVPLEGIERVLCLNEKDGQVVWKYEQQQSYSLSYPAGPRATPTVDGDRVYSLGAEGNLVCLSVDTGKVLWQKNLKDEYKTESPLWGYSAPPLVYGDLLISLAGGDGSIVVAFNKHSGKEVWRALSASNCGYCPPVIINAAGQEQLVVWTPRDLNGLDPKTGKVLWSTDLVPQYDMSIAAPVVNGDRMYVSGIGEVAKMYRLNSDKPGVTEIWKGKAKHAVYCSNATPLFVGDHLYGADCGKGSLICIQASDGTRLWETMEATSGGDRRQSHGTAFLTQVGDLAYLFSETGDFIIVKLSPEKYIEVGRFHLIEPTNECFGRKVVWSYPAYANRAVFVRNDEEIACFDLSK